MLLWQHAAYRCYADRLSLPMAWEVPRSAPDDCASDDVHAQRGVGNKLRLRLPPLRRAPKPLEETARKPRPRRRPGRGTNIQLVRVNMRIPSQTIRDIAMLKSGRWETHKAGNKTEI